MLNAIAALGVATPPIPLTRLFHNEKMQSNGDWNTDEGGLEPPRFWYVKLCSDICGPTGIWTSLWLRKSRGGCGKWSFCTDGIKNETTPIVSDRPLMFYLKYPLIGFVINVRSCEASSRFLSPTFNFAATIKKCPGYDRGRDDITVLRHKNLLYYIGNNSRTVKPVGIPLLFVSF